MTASDHRSRAREVLKGNWPMAALVTLIASLLGGVSSNGNYQFEINSGDVFSLESLLPDWANNLIALFGIALAAFAIIGVIVCIALAVIGSAVKLGYHRYTLDLLDRRETGIRVLFSQFHRLGAAVVMNLLRGLAVFVGMLLLIVPGLILSYSFSMADFIMTEDPSCSATDALRRSNALMKGHKWDLFVLDLSFIGWALLVSLTLGIGNLFLTPYQTTARASFYRNIRGQNRYVIEDGYITVE